MSADCGRRLVRVGWRVDMLWSVEAVWGIDQTVGEKVTV